MKRSIMQTLALACALTATPAAATTAEFTWTPLTKAQYEAVHARCAWRDGKRTALDSAASVASGVSAFFAYFVLEWIEGDGGVAEHALGLKVVSIGGVLVSGAAIIDASKTLYTFSRDELKELADELQSGASGPVTAKLTTLAREKNVDPQGIVDVVNALARSNKICADGNDLKKAEQILQRQKAGAAVGQTLKDAKGALAREGFAPTN